MDLLSSIHHYPQLGVINAATVAVTHRPLFLENKNTHSLHNMQTMANFECISKGLAMQTV